MTPMESLHTFARRYCIEQSRLWHERYAVSGVKANSTQSRTIYPRYHALEAILVEVERKTPADFASTDVLLGWMAGVGQTAENFFTRLPQHQAGAAKQAIDEEREKFCDALRVFVQKQDWDVVPMPSRRTLSEPESQMLWARLRERWDVYGENWYPLREVSVPDPKVAFWADALEAKRLPETLRRLLAARGMEKLWELREYQSEPDVEMDLALLAPYYNFSEGYWTSGNMDWLVYASHENTLTFAGDWLVAEVKAAWPDWEKFQWNASWKQEYP